ncbi:outer capsid protein [Atlantic halibut reovirus]|nr:outer capsid protein [Atlantic halibut reovirus]
MDTKPLHPTVANALCDALTSGHIQIAKTGSQWGTHADSPDIISTGQYQICACCFKQVCCYHSPNPTSYVHECHASPVLRANGRKLAENLMTMSHSMRSSVNDAINVMSVKPDTPVAVGTAIRHAMSSNEYCLAKLGETMARMTTKGQKTTIVSLDSLSKPINAKRALTFYGKDLSQHPLIQGTALTSELEEMTGGETARIAGTETVVVQISGMAVPVVFDKATGSIFPVLSGSNRAVLIHAMMTQSCAQVTTGIQARMYGSRGSNLSQLAVHTENEHSSNRGMRGCCARFVDTAPEA